MPSAEFTRICRDLSQFGESITFACTKEGIKFSASGDYGSGEFFISRKQMIMKKERN
jgi:proliferating cell nuclear antigen